MKEKLSFLIVIGIIVTGFITVNSCEKESTKRPIDGIWDFNMNCNKNLYRGCIFSINRDFKETVKIDGNSFTRFYDDSLVFSDNVKISDSVIIFGNDIFSQQFILRNDTLTLIDTCFACDYNVYIKRK
ncbi:MAG: hypothetical protein HC905_09590 [Bacteroidales bacterium]|nr:hypothetical protein [Bacteroidales bacterium]